MSPMNMTSVSIHPGEILLEEFMKPQNLRPHQLAKSTGLNSSTVARICQKCYGITPDTALRLAAFFQPFAQEAGARFWMNLQVNYDLARRRRILAVQLKKIKGLGGY